MALTDVAIKQAKSQDKPYQLPDGESLYLEVTPAGGKRWLFRYRFNGKAIPTRKNARPWKGSSLGVLARNEILRATKRLGRAIWKRWSGYHRRSLVETKMHCFKRLGERVTARRFDGQVAELQVRAAILNRFSMLGRPCTVVVA